MKRQGGSLAELKQVTTFTDEYSKVKKSRRRLKQVQRLTVREVGGVLVRLPPLVLLTHEPL